MIYVDITDITDKIISVTEEDIEAANEYVSSLQKKFCVKDEAVVIPLPFCIKRLAVVYACYTAALDAVGTDNTETLGENRQRIDIYEQKRRAYLAELNMLTATLSADDFTGATAAGGNVKITLGRS